MKKDQKKTSLMFPLGVFGVAVILVAFSLLTSKTSLNSRGTEELPAIQNAEDLNEVDSELVNTDLNEFDKQLNELDIDASTF